MLPLEPDDSPWAVPNIPFLNFQHDDSGYPDLARPMPPSDLMSITDHGLVQLAKPGSSDLDMIQGEPAVGPATTTVVSNHDGFSAEADSIFVNGENDFSHLNGGWPLMPDWDISNWVADIPMDPPAKNEEVLEYGGPADADSRQMYPHWAHGFDAANASCQTFFSTSSSDGDARLLTPPPKTSPMPTLPPELEVRRGSSSSDLAKNLDTIRLQQPRSRTGLRDEVFCSPPPSDAGAVVERAPTSDPHGVVTGAPPGTSFGGVGKPSPVPRIDLASRRKRPRPAALRPDSQRSHSCAAPLTLSPHAQVSASIGIGSSPSVRRIRSTGQNLNATGGGVQKPGLRSAQLSPRNLQSFLGATGMRMPSPIKRQSTSPTQAPASHGKPPTPMTPGKVDLQSEVWPNVGPYLASPVFPWQANDPTAPFAPAAGPVISSPPMTPFNIDAFPPMFPLERQPDSSYPYPPQSAPPEQTSFVFGDSPPVAPAGNPSVWQVPSSGMPTGPYSEDPTMALGRQTQTPPFNFSRLHYHPMGGRQPYSHGPPHLASGRSALVGNRPAPPKEIEIQVNLIPKPQGVAQTRKQYTFNHTTPKDFVYASS